MSDKERLELIKKSVKNLLLLADSEGIGEVDITEVYQDMSWLIEKAEKVEQLQQENERLKKFLNWEQEEAQGLDEEVTFQLEQLKQAQTKIERYEKALREIANEQEVGEGDKDLLKSKSTAPILEEEFKVLIDLALATKDFEWCRQLVKQLEGRQKEMEKQSTLR
jgi:hypothetical protein